MSSVVSVDDDVVIIMGSFVFASVMPAVTVATTGGSGEIGGGAPPCVACEHQAGLLSICAYVAILTRSPRTWHGSIVR